jgi:hypothetical protein
MAFIVYQQSLRRNPGWRFAGGFPENRPARIPAAVILVEAEWILQAESQNAAPPFLYGSSKNPCSTPSWINSVNGLAGY